MGRGAFESCAALITVNAPQLENLGVNAFNACGRLVTLNLPKVKIIEDDTFFECDELTTLILSSSVKVNFSEDPVIDLPPELQLECSELKQIIVNNNDDPAWDKSTFISRLPSHLRDKKIHSTVGFFESFCCTKKNLAQNIAISDIETQIATLYHPLLFSPLLVTEPSMSLDASSAASHP